MTGESLVGLVRKVIPDFKQSIREQKRIRAYCKSLSREVESSPFITLINAEDRDLTYLSNEAENHCVEADSILKDFGKQPMRDRTIVNLSDNAEQELKDTLDDAVDEINRSIRRISVIRGLFLMLLMMVVGGAVWVAAGQCQIYNVVG